jgi:hypothetical protein
MFITKNTVQLKTDIYFELRTPGPLSVETVCLAFLNETSKQWQCVDVAVESIERQDVNGTSMWFIRGKTPHFTKFAVMPYTAPPTESPATTAAVPTGGEVVSGTNVLSATIVAAMTLATLAFTASL